MGNQPSWLRFGEVAPLTYSEASARTMSNNQGAGDCRLNFTCDSDDLDVLEDEKAHKGPPALRRGPEDSSSAANHAAAVLKMACTPRICLGMYSRQ